MNKKHIFIIGVAVFLMLFMLLKIVFDDNGVLDLYEVRKKINVIEATNEKLRLENKKLATIIERLKNDQKYVEDVARKELGMVGKDEIIFKFKNEVKKTKKAGKK
ncbi:MAG: septum formation initiator family protein [Desulfobacterales bacterium]|nr:septum formation initiator family protein [Desulfobacterales bacterium]MCP4160082.1 septum formation initiator family protein [Deltaproteobacteria bacterium]